jgi:hypothetical protein
MFDQPGAAAAERVTRESRSRWSSVWHTDRRDYVAPALLSLILGAAGMVVFWHMAFLSGGDIDAHDHFILRFAESHVWPSSYFLYHIVVWTLSGFSHSLNYIGAAAAVVLTASLVARALAAYAYLLPSPTDGAAARWKAAAVAAGLVTAMPLPNWWKFPDVYLGQFTPNVWHSATLIVAMPFTIVLFAAAMATLRGGDRRLYVLTSVMIVCVALAKPSYLLSFVPVYTVALLLSLGAKTSPRSRGLIGLAVVLCPVLLVLAAQYYVEFKAGARGMSFSPFAVWRLYSPNLAASFGLSLAFPLVTAAVAWRHALRDLPLKFAWAVFAVAWLESVVLAEKGVAFAHANFMWGSYAALFILFMASARVLLVARLRGWLPFVAWGVFWVHAASGVMYVVYLVGSGARY